MAVYRYALPEAEKCTSSPKTSIRPERTGPTPVKPTASAKVVGRYAPEGANHPHGMYVDATSRLLFVAHKGNATLAGVREWAQAGLGEDSGGYRAEFLGMVKKVEGK